VRHVDTSSPTNLKPINKTSTLIVRDLQHQKPRHNLFLCDRPWPFENIHIIIYYYIIVQVIINCKMNRQTCRLQYACILFWISTLLLHKTHSLSSSETTTYKSHEMTYVYTFFKSTVCDETTRGPNRRNSCTIPFIMESGPLAV
jgi:hypothetical protein